eukprot:CAMPEP_0115131752 /NCGR_PEP_ID=MMETSP0227-20121206/53317_1 /TAXON_ID=89957 /ORGANISM="Polarella glacialis, Strain CCMP 1383" /LENGTH=67 /DNA_ID=CAMNT_0002537359 /DNA_START=1 /DNA_END=201 /DNA_ORIENTATION=-
MPGPTDPDPGRTPSPEDDHDHQSDEDETPSLLPDTEVAAQRFSTVLRNFDDEQQARYAAMSPSEQRK